MTHNTAMQNAARPWLALLVAALLLSVPAHALADAGPKPSIEVQVTYQGQPVPDDRFSASLLACTVPTSEPSDRCYASDPAACSQFTALRILDSTEDCSWQQAVMAWGGDCENGLCHFSYYLPARFRLAVYLPGEGKMFVSDPIARPNFNGTYDADLQSDGSARIAETTTPMGLGRAAPFVAALVLSVPIELFVALLFVLITHTRPRILWAVLISTPLSLPVVWFVFPHLGRTWSVILFGELFAVLFEAALVYVLNRKAISKGRSLLLSTLMNGASFILCGPVLFLLEIFGLQ